MSPPIYFRTVPNPITLRTTTVGCCPSNAPDSLSAIASEARDEKQQ